MAKKVRRPRRRQIDTSTDESEEQASSRSLSAQETFEKDYAYVLSDLRWVFILAAIMFALLIALNLILGG